MAERCGLQATGCGLQGNMIHGRLAGGLEMPAWLSQTMQPQATGPSRGPHLAMAGHP